MSPERDRAVWPDLQSIPRPSSQTQGHQHPFAAISHPILRWPFCWTAPVGLPWEGLAGTSTPTGICLRTAPPSILKPPSPLTSPDPSPRRPCPHHRWKDGGSFLPKQNTDRVSGHHACFQRWVAIQTTGPEVAGTCAQDRGGLGRWQDQGPSSPLTAPSGPGYNLDTSLTTSDFLLRKECNAISI